MSHASGCGELLEQVPLSQDPPLQVQAGQVDLPVEPLRGRQRPDLLPLIGASEGRHGGLP